MESTSLLANRLQATPPLFFPKVGSATMPIPIKIQEPDFNKAIASVIWFRHRRQPTSTIFNCQVSNCPLCPPVRASGRSLVEQKRTSQLQEENASRTERPAVVNWLIPSLTPTSNFGSDRKESSSCTSSPPTKRFAHSLPRSPDRHSTVVTQGRLKFKCPSCPMSFSKKTHLRIHRLAHIGHIYCCQYCKKHFANRSSLVRHRRLHTGERPYRCSFEGCQSVFTQPGTLNRHYKSHFHGRSFERKSM